MDFIPLVNGTSYYWASITLNIMGVPFAGVKAIEYREKQKIDNIYGLSRRPVSRGYGSIMPEAKITLLAEEVQNIVNTLSLPGGAGLLDVPAFDITVAFIDEKQRFAPFTHVLKNAEFTNNEMSTKVDDTSIEVPLDLVISHIIWK